MTGSDVRPADLSALLQHLSAVNDLSGPDHPENNGTVEIQTIASADGTVRHIVYLPGTDDLTTTPWSQDGDVRDLGTNLLLVSGQDNAYQQGILDAMGQAGIRPGEPVALVGHSQGGMEAAAMLAHGSPYAVTTVVTAGAPTAYLDGFPPGSHVLSLENQGDVVPLLDGADNADSAEQVTVRFDDHETSVVGNHGLGALRRRRGCRRGQRRPVDPRPAGQPGDARFHGVRGGAGGHQPGLPDHPRAVSAPAWPAAGLAGMSRGNERRRPTPDEGECMYGDTLVMRKRAAQLREQGEDIRAMAEQLVTRSDEVAWSGRAADSMRERVRDRAAHLREAANAHDTAAATLEKHLGECDRLGESIAGIERRASAARGGRQALDRSSPPPPSGHKDWLTVELPGL